MTVVEIADTIEKLSRALSELEKVTNSCVQRKALLEKIGELTAKLKVGE